MQRSLSNSLTMASILVLAFLLCVPVSCLSSLNNSTTQACHGSDRLALLQFKNALHVDPASAYYSECGDDQIAKTSSWNTTSDCCTWNGVHCDSSTGHVTGLDLSCSFINGTIDSNSTLFNLRQLQSLNLAFNYFNPPTISPKFGEFPSLKHLNLSSCGFSGRVPAAISQLSELVSLDLSSFYSALEMPDFADIVANLTKLTLLDLDYVKINAVMPASITNLSSLASLSLVACNLEGELNTEIVNLPRLKVLILLGNDDLVASFSDSNWTSPLEVIEFDSRNFSGELPDSLAESGSPRWIYLGGCQFHGSLPTWLWRGASEIQLGGNYFSGELPLTVNLSRLANLTTLDLSENLLVGAIPPWLFALQSLRSLDLHGNKFSGQISNFMIGSSLGQINLSRNNLSGSVHLEIFSEAKNLFFLSLSNNSLSVTLSRNSTSPWPTLSVLGLSSCNLDAFPYFLRSQDELQILDLSRNKIGSEIPNWLGNNSSSLDYVDLSHNELQGPIPASLAISTYFVASNNRLTGAIPSSLCDLKLLDLSGNNLSGEIPVCLGNSSSLSVLNLRSNQLHGNLPFLAGGCDSLTYFNVNSNHLKGSVPHSMATCRELKVLDLGNNKFNASFPYYLDALANLRILILHNNFFNGAIESSESKHPFPMLRIADFSGNSFTGDLPERYMETFVAMMNNTSGTGSLDYMRDVFSDLGVLLDTLFPVEYLDSVILTVKGSIMNYEKILTVFSMLDLSNNEFKGEIPESIGGLVSLQGLNLSHNHLAGKIPASVGDLVMLEFLDLSFNMLAGEIPQELARLNYLAVFNVSENRLVGPIPNGKQFDTFQNESYMGNPGLCGFPRARAKCGGNESPWVLREEGSKWADLSEWEIFLVGCGFGLTIGLAGGSYMLLVEKPFWLLRWIYKVDVHLKEYLNKRRRRAYKSRRE